MIKRNKPIISAVTLIVLAGIISGCDTTFDPFIEDKALYSIYGYLGINREVNYIRIKDLDSPLIADSTRKIDAKVTLTNLASGQTQVLQDSVVRFGEIYMHNFRTTMNITSETKYRVQVTRSDGRSVSATTVTPAVLEVELDFSRNVIAVFQPVSRQSIFRYTLSLTPFDQAATKTQNFCLIFVQTKQFIGYKKILGYCSPEYISSKMKRKRVTIPRKFLYSAESASTVEKFYLLYKHYAPNSFKPVTTSDSLSIPGGSGQFGAVYTDTLIIELPQ